MEILGLTVPLWLLLIVIILVLYTYMMSRHHGTFKKLNIPGPAPWPIIGSLPEISKKGIHNFQYDCMKKYGKVFGFYGGVSPSTIVVGDKEMLRQIMIKEFANFSDRMTINGLNGDLDSSLLCLSGDHWRHVRNKITPAFSSGKLRKMCLLVDTCSDTLVQSLKRKVKDGHGVMDMMDAFGGYTMDVICSTAFGIQVDSQQNPNDEFVLHAKKFLDVNFSSPILLVLMFLPKLIPLIIKLGWTFADKNTLKFFRQVTIKLLNERVSGDKNHADFLQLMKNVQQDVDDSDDDGDKDEEIDGGNNQTKSWRNEGITFDEVLGNAEIFFFAGYETTTASLAMAAYHLAVHPECQEKLRQELATKIGSNPLTYDNVQKVEYLEMVINETLRIHPVAIQTDRMCMKDTVIGGIRIPAGLSIGIPIYCIHHDPDNWEDPDKFIPERFAGKDNHDPLNFLPFGYGPRNCVGMRLALMEMKMALAKVVRNFKMSVCKETQVPPDFHRMGLLKPKSSNLKLEKISP
ncbi:LOW QUALITY PROTEIN: cytochrome P450 3A8-like [Argopecten irradians]|uniref:LOW QUALITY PROTEIN: cytochrome P450 3A8-like n=1 Tax=Argopecten irradians TaxID=31199 RepID=UPI00371BB324